MSPGSSTSVDDSSITPCDIQSTLPGGSALPHHRRRQNRRSAGQETHVAASGGATRSASIGAKYAVRMRRRVEAVPSPADGGTRRFRGHGLQPPPPEATWHAGFVNQGLQWAMGADRSGTPAVETTPEVRSVNGEARRWCLIGALYLRARW